MPAGRPTLYRDEYCDEIVDFCREGYSLTAFAGKIGVSRDTISEWCAVHPEFSVAARRAKAACAHWWETRNRQVGLEGGPGGQATVVLFNLKNHAPDDYSAAERHELTGKDGAPIALTIAAQREAAAAIIETTFREFGSDDDGKDKA